MLGRRSLLDTALMLWEVTEQHKMAMGVLASVSHAHDGTGGSQNVGDTLPLNVEQPLTSHHTLADLVSSCC